MIKFNKIKLKDKEEINKWWLAWGLEKPHDDCLSPNGFIISKNNLNIAAGYLYLTDAKIGYVDFLVSNPEYRDKDRNKLITELIDYLVNIGLNKDCRFIWATSSNTNIKDKVKKLNYNVLDDKHYVIYKHR